MTVGVLGAVVLGSGVFAAVLAWRLRCGPIELPFLAPYLAAAVSRPDFIVRIGSTALMWDQSEHKLRLRAVGVEARNRAGDVLAVVPEAAIALSLRALVRGDVEPAEVVLQGLHVHLALHPDGTVDLGLEGSPGEPIHTSPEALSGGFFETVHGAAPTSRLRSIVIAHGAVDLVATDGGMVWRARDVDILLRAALEGIEISVRGELLLGPTPVPVDLSVVAGGRPERVDLALAFRRLDPSAVGPSLPLPPDVASVLAAVRLPVDGRVVLALDEGFRLSRARMKVAGGRAGSIAVPALAGGSVPVALLRAALIADVPQDLIGLQLASFQIGRTDVRLQGDLRPLHGPRRADLTLSVGKIGIDELGRYWPDSVATAARQWMLANVRGGHVRDAVVRVAATLNESGPAPPAWEAVTGSFRVDGVTVASGPDMPPFTAVAGRGTFSKQGMRIHVARGAIAGLELVHGTVDVAGADRPDPRVDIDVAMRGPLARAVSLLRELPETAAIRRLGIMPDDVGGRITGRVVMVRPPRAGIHALSPRVSATLNDVSVAHISDGWTLTGGDFAVELARDGTLTTDGKARVQGVPVSIAWRGDVAGGPSTAQVRGDIDAPGCTALGFPAFSRFDGRVGVDGHYESRRAGAATLGLLLDLATAGSDAVPVPFRKRVGEPGSARIDLALSGGAVTAVSLLDLRVGGTRVTGRATLADGRIVKSLDARAVLAPRAPHPPGHLTLTVTPGRPRPRFRVASEDAGSVVAALGPELDLKHGRLVFEGSVDTAGAGCPLEGELDVRSFMLTRAPLLARVASLASLGGVTAALSGRSGIGFDRLHAEVTHRDGVVTLTKATASSASLGISAKGAFDYEGGTVALHGNLVPAYGGLNTAPAAVPIIGHVLTGTKREGIQVFDFEVSGALARPDVSVRHSSIAPGMVRDLVRLLYPTRTR